MMSTSTQKLLDMTVVLEDTNNHQVIQKLLLMAQEGLAAGCKSTEEWPPSRKKTIIGGRGGGC